MRVPGVFDDGNDVGSLFGDIDEVTTRSVRELHGVNETFRTDDVGNVGNGGSRCGAQVKYLWSREGRRVGGGKDC